MLAKTAARPGKDASWRTGKCVAAYHRRMNATSSTAELSLRSLFDAQHRASRAQVDVPLAVQADFGVRSPQLTEIADLFVLRTLLSHTLKHLPKWARPETFRPDHGAAQALVVRRSSALVFFGRREGIIKRCC